VYELFSFEGRDVVTSGTLVAICQFTYRYNPEKKSVSADF